MGSRKDKIMDTVDKIDKDKLIKHIIRWLNINIDYYDPKYFDNRKDNYLAQDESERRPMIMVLDSLVNYLVQKKCEI